MALQKCGLNRNNKNKELQPHGSLEFPCAGYESTHTNAICDFIPWHWHEEVEFGYVLNGEIEITLANRTCHVKKNQGYFTNSNVLSRFSKTTDTMLAHTHLFHPIFLGGHFKSIFETKYLNPVIQNKNIDALIFTDETPSQQKILQKLRQAGALQHQDNVEFQTRNLFSELWLLLLDEIREQPSHTVNIQNQQRVQSMLAFIHANYNEKLTLEAIAAAASVSTRECIRCFHNTIRQTPIEYVMEYRLNMARKLLNNSEMSLISVITAVFHPMLISAKFFEKNMG